MRMFIFYTLAYGQVRVPGLDETDAQMELVRRGYHNPRIVQVREE